MTNEGLHKISNNARSYLNFPRCNKCHNEELQLLGSIVKMLGVLVTWCPGIGCPWIDEMTSMIGVSNQNVHVTCWKILYWYLRDWKYKNVWKHPLT